MITLLTLMLLSGQVMVFLLSHANFGIIRARPPRPLMTPLLH